MQRELYALGSAVFEVTAWKFPYADISGDIWDIIESGTMPVMADNNPACDIITRCWYFGYDSAKAVADDLADVLDAKKQTLLPDTPEFLFDWTRG
ncbi:hypothetical protein CDEST_02238 [Colletotrichum destructivum]|uniref:Uncharacterized protein n=1 Tax=Colletotrichum destructivum TaxID=34406 RepID=A0AAX4I1I5_9PEZI|nr:hypothetical protein CDEST_02238 [Colletotrichum destructivum]